MIAVSRVAVNHDGKGGGLLLILRFGTRGAPRKARKTDIRVNVDLASLPRPCGFKNWPWMQVHGGCIIGFDVAAWP